MKRFDEFERALKNDPVEKPSAGFTDDVLRALACAEKEPVPVSRGSSWISVPRLAYALAAVATIVCASGVFLVFKGDFLKAAFSLKKQKTASCNLSSVPAYNNMKTVTKSKEVQMSPSTPLKVIALAAALSFADSADTGKAAADNDGVKPEAIAKDFNITADSVNALKTTYKIGYGGVNKALALSLKTGLTVDEILLMKTEQKMGWGQIEMKLGEKANKAENSTDKAEVKAKKAEKKAEKAEKKAEKAERKAERPNK